MSAARRAGDFRTLYPRGVKRVDQVPWPLQEAINHALVILAWYENHLSDEIPPETLWDDGEFVEEWFNAIQEKKDAERDGWSPKGDDDDDPSDLMGNDLASVFKR